jgi:hypothetical protein
MSKELKEAMGIIAGIPASSIGVKFMERATPEAKPSASAAPGKTIHSREFHELAMQYRAARPFGGASGAYKQMTDHIDAAIAAAREEAREDGDAAINAMATIAVLLGKTGGPDEVVADLRARLAAPEGEAVAEVVGWERFGAGYGNTLKWLTDERLPEGTKLHAVQPQAKAPQQPACDCATGDAFKPYGCNLCNPDFATPQQPPAGEETEKVTCAGCKGTGEGVINAYSEAGGCSDCNGKGYDWEPK